MIGIFDSGVGGLSVYQKIKEIYPEKKIIYVADQNNFPYGEKSESELLNICSENIDFLLEQGVKIIVIACNSATVSTIKKLRSMFQIPIIGIEPAIKLAVKNSKNGKIGLMATARTIHDHNGEKWLNEGQYLYKTQSSKLISKIEKDFANITDDFLIESVVSLTTNQVDSIVLGCTHYHFVKVRLERLFPNITFYAPDKEVAKRIAEIVDLNGIELENGQDQFFSSKDHAELEKFLKEVVENEAKNVRTIQK